MVEFVLEYYRVVAFEEFVLRFPVDRTVPYADRVVTERFFRRHSRPGKASLLRYGPDSGHRYDSRVDGEPVQKRAVEVEEPLRESELVRGESDSSVLAAYATENFFEFSVRDVVNERDSAWNANGFEHLAVFRIVFL